MAADPPVNPLSLGAQKPPTRKHRPLVWENMLGTVYATDGQTVRYFDFDWDAALAFAGVPDATDLRSARNPHAFRVGDHTVDARRFVLWGVR